MIQPDGRRLVRGRACVLHVADLEQCKTIQAQKLSDRAGGDHERLQADYTCASSHRNYRSTNALYQSEHQHDATIDVSSCRYLSPFSFSHLCSRLDQPGSGVHHLQARSGAMTNAAPVSLCSTSFSLSLATAWTTLPVVSRIIAH